MTISEVDFDSLMHLSAIQLNEIVDVDANSEVGAPYPYSWGTFSLWANGNNYLNLIPLFERTFFSMHMRQGYLAAYVRKCLPGLCQLKETLPDSAQEIDKVLQFVQIKLEKWNKKQGACDFQTPVEGDALYAELERSVFMHLIEQRPSVPLNSITGIEWVVRKIDAFMQAAEGVSKEDKILLKQMRSILMSTGKWETLSKIWEEESQMTPLEIKQVVANGIQALMDSLQDYPQDVRENMGFIVPFSIEMPKCAHAVILGVCQNADGSFMLSQYNAGLGAEVESYSFELNMNNLVIPYGKTVVEYGPLTAPAVHAFLFQLHNKKIHCETEELACQAYRQMFIPLHPHISGRQIPTRRLQVTGNCSMRNPLEWILFSLQKYGKVELANHLLKVSPARDAWDSPAIEFVAALP